MSDLVLIRSLVTVTPSRQVSTKCKDLNFCEFGLEGHSIGTTPLIISNGLSHTKLPNLKLKFLGYKMTQFFCDCFSEKDKSPGFIFLKRKKNNVKAKVSI